MQTHLFVSDKPRSLALRPTVLEETPSGVLIFEQVNAQYNSFEPPKCNVKLIGSSEFDASKYSIVNSRPVYGCLGLINVQNECFLAVVTDCVPVGRVRPGEDVYKIQTVNFYSLANSQYDDLDTTYNKDTWDTDDDTQNNVIQHPCAQLQKLFSNGSFYFTPDFDLTRTVQARTSTASFGVHSFDEHFMWNQFLISGLMEFRSKLDKEKQQKLDRGGFLVFAIQGSVGMEEVEIGGEKFELSVISKLSCQRAGTRFNTRGIDDHGHVANFVETETILYSDRTCLSFTQIRGSVPVFWEQQGVQLINHKIQIARSSTATQPAVNRHFQELLVRYDNVHILNLLSHKDNSGEQLLSNAYDTAVQNLPTPPGAVVMTDFDLHNECKGGSYENVSKLMQRIQSDFSEYGVFVMDSNDNRIGSKQRGVFRTNCLDCLDRTNLVQNELSRLALTSYLANRPRSDKGYGQGYDGILSRHSHLWAENGDNLSKLYAGTGALKSAFTRTGKVTFMSVLGDATKSVNRFYINNFQDKAKQEVIDQLLGKLTGQKEIAIYDPIQDSVSEIMLKRLQEYSSVQKITIFAGTYNLNGQSYQGESLDAWILQHLDLGHEEPDIFCIGFQEIVKLSPQQVMSTDIEKRKAWERQLEITLNKRSKKSPYIALRSNQLVGAALLLYVKQDIVHNIRNVESVVKKTGLMGMAGNKGAVAIRLDYCDTSFCFVCAHLASGHSNIEERNADFLTIDQGLMFPKGRGIESHDNIVWVSDLNYRISMSNEEVRSCIDHDDLQTLADADQLLQQISENKTFPGYREGTITFQPTYKYDLGTDIYDTSEKQRVPAWTDRILFKGPRLQLLQYARAELYTSDHRPVLAIFEAEITTLDHAAEAKMKNELYKEKLQSGVVTQVEVKSASNNKPPLPLTPRPIYNRPPPPPPPPATVVDPLVDIDDDDDDDNDSDDESLPMPSSDDNKWWEDGKGNYWDKSSTLSQCVVHT
ncbi:SacI homology domain-containing protein [Umbelopsis sp. AD052]|nr:SacI homology domain-containing protein [Umbelopsis sp. AD052]